jgi:hypothetical protein
MVAVNRAVAGSTLAHLSSVRDIVLIGHSVDTDVFGEVPGSPVREDHPTWTHRLVIVHVGSVTQRMNLATIIEAMRQAPTWVRP